MNHRPVVPLERHLIQHALAVIADRLGKNSELSWKDLREVLTTEGEKIDEADLDTYLGALIGDPAAALDPEDVVDAHTFATRVLGFEEVV